MFVEYDDELCFVSRRPGVYYISCSLFENLQVPTRLCRNELEFTSMPPNLGVFYVIPNSKGSATLWGY